MKRQCGLLPNIFSTALKGIWGRYLRRKSLTNEKEGGESAGDVDGDLQQKGQLDIVFQELSTSERGIAEPNNWCIHSTAMMIASAVQPSLGRGTRDSTLLPVTLFPLR